MADSTHIDAADSDLASLVGRAHLPASLRHASGMAKLDHITSLAHPETFVAELATEDLYWLLSDIGKTDAYVLLEYATPEQMRGLVDIDAWHKHTIELGRWLDWLDLAVAADLDVGLNFLRAQDDDLLEWLFVKDVTVHGADLETDTVPDELALLESPDGLYYVTVPHDHPLTDRLPRLMKLLWAADTDRARLIFQHARFDLPSAVEASLSHFREARLADLGFVGPTEALEVFSAVAIKPLKRQVREQLEDFAEVRPLPRGNAAFDLALVGVSAPDLLGRSVTRLDAEARERVGLAMTNLVNKVYMAVTQDLSRTDALPEAGHHAASLANLGLAWLADEDEERGAEVLRRIGPETLFRTGYTLVFEIGLRARRVRRRAGADRGFTVFGSPVDETLEGVAWPRPLRFEGLTDPGRVGYRPFATLDELARVEVTVDEADTLLAFFETSLGFRVEALGGPALAAIDDDARQRIQLSTMFRTGLANLLLSDEFSFTPLDRDDLAAFAGLAFDGHQLSPRVRDAMRSTLEAVPPAVSGWIERTMATLVAELGEVRPDDLDPRFTGDLFLVADG